MNSRENLKARLHEEYLPEMSESVAQRVFDYAWEEGHSSGEAEVTYYYQDLAELVRESIADVLGGGE